jgi:GNAT superfamily N-acetyltransferase
MLPAEFLDSLDVDTRASLYGFDGPDDPVMWIAVNDAVVGFVAVSACRDSDASDVGEIQALYVAPDRWRSGAGTLLLAKGESRRDGLRGGVSLGARGERARSLFL